MASRDNTLNPESEDFQQGRPTFFIGQHDSTRTCTLTDTQHGQVLNAGVSYNSHKHLLTKVDRLS